MMTDPINTTASDGAPCALCGADAVWAPVVTEGSQRKDTALCGSCTDHDTVLCGRCGDRIWARQGSRLFGTPELYCAGCAAELLPAIEAHRVPDADDLLLVSLQRRTLLTEGSEAAAELIYRLRALYIGGLCLPWGMLTEGQRDGYRAEVRDLVTKTKGES